MEVRRFPSDEEESQTVRPLQCPGPVVRIKKELDGLPAGATIKVLGASGFAPDLGNCAKSSGHMVVKLTRKDTDIEAIVRKGSRESARR